MSTNTDPIAYQLLMLAAIRKFLAFKHALPARYGSIDILIDIWRMLSTWADTGNISPIGHDYPQSFTDFINDIIAMRRSRAAQVDPTDAEDDGLEWLTDLTATIGSIIARPKEELDDA